MMRIVQLYGSLVGRKIIAATTGLVLLGFLILHAFGNLNCFAGIDANGLPAIDAYAEYLRDLATPLVPRAMLLWLVRILLVTVAALHVLAVLSLARHNLASRQKGYRKHRLLHTSLAARWVLASGTLLLLFIVTHVMQFTFGLLTPFAFSRGEIYQNLTAAFSHGWLVAFYLLALAALGLHLHHGIWSLCQTLGLDNPDRNTALRAISSLVSLGLVVIFASIPLAFYSGLLPSMG